MLKYIIKRILLIIPVLLGVLVVVFTINYISPNDPVDVIAGATAPDYIKEEIRAELGLDQPYVAQLFNCIKGVVTRLNFGNSYITKTSVRDDILARFPITLRLDWLPPSGIDTWRHWILPMISGSVYSIASIMRTTGHHHRYVPGFCHGRRHGHQGGVLHSRPGLSYEKRHRADGYAGDSGLSAVLAPILSPYNYDAMALTEARQYPSPAHWLGTDNGVGKLNCAIAIGVPSIPSFARIIRASVLSIKDQEYIEAGRACGVRDWTIIMRHVIPNSLAPIMVQSTLRVGESIMMISSLSFIGLGVQPSPLCRSSCPATVWPVITPRKSMRQIRKGVSKQGRT